VGVNKEALGLLALARASGADFSRVVTIGRHRLSAAPEYVDHFFRQRGRADLAMQLAANQGDGYCEPLLKIAFGAGVIQSIDASSYENADIIHDMNTPIEAAERYSIVGDFGTLEHVFNVPVAFDNMAKLAAPNAYILHMLPSNNFVGHGFYQFSPELFFQIYSPERGYTGTRVFGAPGSTPDIWYEIRAPRDLKSRVNITSRDQLHMMVMTQKTGDPVPLVQKPVQQSDYMDIWDQGEEKLKTTRRRGEVERVVRDALNGLRQRRKVGRKDLTRARSDIIRRPVRDLAPTF
jgi:hypothetical protein